MKTSIRTIALFIVLIVFSCTSSNTSESELINRINDVQEQIAKQGNISEEEKLAILSLASLVDDENDFSKSNKDAISYSEVEVKPIYAGCEAEVSEDCFKEKLADLIEAEFNKDLLQKTEMNGEATIEYFFQINKDGTISNRKIRESNVVVLAELARVLKLIPNMKPGSQNEKLVDVMYTGKFTYGG